MLIRAGANVNARNNFGLTPLHYAARVGAANFIKIFLDAKVDIEPCVRTEETPLLMAAANDRLDVVKLLISHGANQKARNKQNQDATRLAALHRCPAAYALLNPRDPVLPPEGDIMMLPNSSLAVTPNRAMTASPSPEQQKQELGAFGLSNYFYTNI